MFRIKATISGGKISALVNGRLYSEIPTYLDKEGKIHLFFSVRLRKLSSRISSNFLGQHYLRGGSPPSRVCDSARGCQFSDLESYVMQG